MTQHESNYQTTLDSTKATLLPVPAGGTATVTVTHGPVFHGRTADVTEDSNDGTIEPGKPVTLRESTYLIPAQRTQTDIFVQSKFDVPELVQ